MPLGGGIKGNLVFSSLNFLIFSKRKKHFIGTDYFCNLTRKDTFLLARISEIVVTDLMHYPKGNQHQASPSPGDFQDPLSQLNFLYSIQILALTRLLSL